MLAGILIAPAAVAEECAWPTAAETADLPQSANPGVPDKDLPIEVTSGRVELTRERDATLSDGVKVRQGGRELTATSATYDGETEHFEVQGDVEYRTPDLTVRGASGTWSSAGGGRFTGTKFELPARPARGAAQELVISPEGALGLREVSFTSCPAGNKDWMLRASSIDIDRERQQGKGRNVRVELKGVPILYAPVISFPVGDARKSGFLFPSIGTSNRSGFELGIPYYFNLAPNYDLTLTPRLLSQRGVGSDLRFRYLTGRSHGEIGGRYLPGDDETDSNRGFAQYVHRTSFTDRLRLDSDFAWASDDRYFEDFGLGPDGTSVSYLDRHVNLAWLGRHWRLDGRVQQFQTIDTTVDLLSRPYARAPQLTFTGDWPLGGSRFVAGVDSEAVWFERDEGVTGLRVDIAPRVAWRLGGPGWHFEPSAAFRATGYDLKYTAPGADDTPTRDAPVLSLDAGLVFERAAGERRRLLQTIEPRMRYTWIPFREQDALPVFDTAVPDTNLVQLFRTNRFVGGDRLGDANEVAVGLTSRILHADSGRQYLSATIGQRFFFERPRVVLPGEIPAARDSSNMVGEFELSAWKNWSARFAVEWDREEDNTLLSQTSIQYRPRRDSVVNLGYRYREGRLEQLDFSAAWPVSRSWQLYARQVYSLREQKSIDSFAGFEYGGCCWRLRLIGRRYLSNSTGHSDTSVMLQLELKGLSSVGSSDDTFLQRGIRGYSPDPADPNP